MTDATQRSDCLYAPNSNGAFRRTAEGRRHRRTLAGVRVALLHLRRSPLMATRSKKGLETRATLPTDSVLTSRRSRDARLVAAVRVPVCAHGHALIHHRDVRREKANADALTRARHAPGVTECRIRRANGWTTIHL